MGNFALSTIQKVISLQLYKHNRLHYIKWKLDEIDDWSVRFYFLADYNKKLKGKWWLKSSKEKIFIEIDRQLAARYIAQKAKEVHPEEFFCVDEKIGYRVCKIDHNNSQNSRFFFKNDTSINIVEKTISPTISKQNIAVIWCDGSFIEPNIGAYGAFIKLYEKDKNVTNFKINGSVIDAKGNNHIETVAILQSIKFVKEQNPKIENILIHSDSKNSVDIFNNIKRKDAEQGKKIKSKEYKKNLHIWREIEKIIKNIKIDIRWVKSHNGNKNNNLSHKLAYNCLKKQINDIKKQI